MAEFKEGDRVRSVVDDSFDRYRRGDTGTIESFSTMRFPMIHWDKSHSDGTKKYADAEQSKIEIYKEQNMSTIDKTKLKERVQNMEQELAAMKAELNKEEAEPEGNEFMRVPAEDEKVFLTSQLSDSGGYSVDEVYTCEHEEWFPTYATAEIARKTAEAQEIWREWTSCKGVVSAKDGVSQFIANYELFSFNTTTVEFKTGVFSPIFDSRENCEASIEKIGVDRIQKMRNYFHFRF